MMQSLGLNEWLSTIQDEHYLKEIFQHKIKKDQFNMLSELKKTQLTVHSVEEQNTQSLFCMC